MVYPMAEFVTTDNTSLNIVTFLISIKTQYINSISDIKFPTHVKCVELYKSLDAKLIARDLKLVVDENIGFKLEKRTYNDLEKTGTIKNDSEFGKYFTEFKKKILESDAEDDLSQSEKINEFYSPQLVEIIDSYMYLVPLWTGMFITNLKYSKLSTVYENNITRFTNNSVENWFNILKNVILQKNRHVKPSFLIGLHAPYLKSIVNNVVDKKRVTKYITTEETPLDAITEWVDKKRTKSTYHDSVNIKNLKTKRPKKKTNKKKAQKSRLKMNLLN
ncbi:unnamed protein product [Brachionus calyciflorus]|uniref:Uncharacterized protein n=1 Tax=Brachionus calyciflorus TaxID=104777 RepID=A0A814LVZ7_9BILA|nr:unnamed protein product [Brachionus calyciflorus]